MKQKKTDCPLSNPLNCKEYYNPLLCAFAREDGKCTKKKKINHQKENPSTEEK